MPFTPIQTLVGAGMMGMSAYHVLILNGKVLGVSGFAHRTTSWIGFQSHNLLDLHTPAEDTSKAPNPDPEHLALLSIVGLVAGGVVLGLFRQPLETQLQTQLVDIYNPTSANGGQAVGLALAGILVGLGSRLSNGCTSGHMLCGVSRAAPRSLVATMVFFPVAVLTRLLAGGLTPFSLNLAPEHSVGQPSWLALVLLQLPMLFYRYGAAFLNGFAGERSARRLVAFTTSLHFALGLIVSGMLRPSKILNFLNFTPTAIQGGSWDPSLALVVVSGILPQLLIWITTLGKHIRQPDTRPAFSTNWSVPMPGAQWWDGIDTRLVLGATLFGVGWGLCGICPGPMAVLLGAASAGIEEVRDRKSVV